MRPSGRPISVVVSDAPHKTSTGSPRITASSPRSAVPSGTLPGGRRTEVERPLPNSGFNGSTSAADPSIERRRKLANAIHKRIETRLAGRVRDLAVRVRANTIVLEGRCATYYTKQLAQHAAMGVIEDEQLENAIVVML